MPRQREAICYKAMTLHFRSSYIKVFTTPLPHPSEPLTPSSNFFAVKFLMKSLCALANPQRRHRQCFIENVVLMEQLQKPKGPRKQSPSIVGLTQNTNYSKHPKHIIYLGLRQGERLATRLQRSDSPSFTCCL